MQYVLDVNKSRTTELLNILSDGNQIILNDDFFVEVFKANTNNVSFILRQNFIHLRKFPLSIFYAKTRGELQRDEILSGQPTNRLKIVCQENTEIIRYLLGLNTSHLTKELSNLNIEAADRIGENSIYSERFIRYASNEASKLDLRLYEKNPDKLRLDMHEVATIILEKYLTEKCSTPFDINDFIGKKSVIFLDTYILLWRILDWAQKKGFDNSKSLINDGFDVKYILTSCFYDGLLTKEKWMHECRESALSFF